MTSIESKKPKRHSIINHEVKHIVAPLSQNFFLASIFGFLISVMFISQYSLSWAVVGGTISGVMFLASMISLTKAPVEDELALDDYNMHRNQRVTVLSKSEYDELKRKRAKNKTKK